MQDKSESTGGSAAEPLSPLQQVFSHFLRHRLAVLSAVLVLVWVIVAVFAPFIAPHDPYRINALAMRQGPSAEHWLGTDLVGRDILSRIIYGSRTSLSVAVGAVGAYVIVGTILGALAGYFGGTIDAIITRLIDIILCFPLILIVLTIVSVMGPSIQNMMLAIAFLRWPQVARYVRAEFLSLREEDFVAAARSIGARPFSIIFRHMLPNALSPIVVVATFGVANTLMLEASLSFLGWGVPPPTASWGGMLLDAQRLSVLRTMPWLWLPPGLAIAVAVLAVNFVGDGLRDALDPHMQI